MWYRRLFDKLTPLSCVALGTDYYGKTIPEPEADALLNAYLEAGGNVVDTAHVYSDYLPGKKHMSEKVIGRWMRSEGTRKDIILCTKGGFPEIGDMHASRIDHKNILRDLQESLKCLKTDHVDIYWLHRDNPEVPVSEIAGWMDEFHRTGAFTYWGVSNWKHGRIEEIINYCRKNGLEPPACSQIKWSLAQPNPGSAGDDTLAEMNEEEYRWYLDHPVPVFAYSSQAKGFFWKLRRSEDGNVQDPGGKAGKRYYNDENLARFRQLEEMSKETGLSPGQLSAAWMTRPGTVQAVPIIGARSREQLDDSLAGAGVLIDKRIAAKYDIFRRDRI